MSNICHHFNSPSGCGKGGSCPFRHVDENDEKEGKRPPRPCKFGSECRHYKEGTCKYDHTLTKDNDHSSKKHYASSSSSSSSGPKPIQRPALPENIKMAEAKNQEERDQRAAAGLAPRPEDVADYQKRLHEYGVKRIMKSCSSNNEEAFSEEDIRWTLLKFANNDDQSADYLFYCRQEKLPIQDRTSISRFQVRD